MYVYVCIHMHILQQQRTAFGSLPLSTMWKLFDLYIITPPTKYYSTVIWSHFTDGKVCVTPVTW